MLLTKREAAEQLSISTRQVNRLIQTGRLPVVRLGISSRGDRIDSADVVALIQESRHRKAQSICRSVNVAAIHGKSASASVDSELRKRYGDPGKMRGALKRKSSSASTPTAPQSSPALRLVEHGATP